MTIQPASMPSLESIVADLKSLGVSLPSVGTSAAPMPTVSQSPFAGYKTYILSALGVFGSAATAAVSYMHGDLTVTQALTAAFGVLGSTAIATLRSAVSDHFGAMGAMVYDMLSQQVEAIVTQQTAALEARLNAAPIVEVDDPAPAPAVAAPAPVVHVHHKHAAVAKAPPIVAKASYPKAVLDALNRGAK